MKQFTYTVPGDIKATAPQPIYDDAQTAVATVARVYENGLKKLLDIYFDYRYFLTYTVSNLQGETQFTVKKIFRRGKVWFEGKAPTGEKYIISYENWRIGVPELFISGNGMKMNIEKQMEGWSEFYMDGTIRARWQAAYDEPSDTFRMTLQIEDDSPVKDVAFFTAIAQATLFIGV